MVKKIVSFVIILLIYCILGAVLLYELSGLFSFDSEEPFTYMYTLDHTGNIYYIKDDGTEQSMISIDESGKKKFNTKLTKDIFGENFYVDSVYVEYEKKIYLTIYEYDNESKLIKSVSVHMFVEDGSYGCEIFKLNTNFYPNACSNKISSFGENDNSVFFSVTDGNTAEVFSIDKSDSAHAEKIAEYTVDMEGRYASYTDSSARLFVGRDGGISVYAEDRTYPDIKAEGAVFDRFWNAMNGVYTADSRTGTLYIIGGDMRLSKILDPNVIINSENKLHISDFTDISLGTSGKFLGTIRGEKTKLFAGSYADVYEIDDNSRSLTDKLNTVLILLGTLAAAVLLSILTWDFYCAILKMRLSILPRQSMLLILLVFVLLYSVYNFAIRPQVTGLVLYDYAQEMITTGDMFIDSMNGTLKSQYGKVTYGGCAEYASNYGKALTESCENTAERLSKTQSINIIEAENGKAVLIASADLYPPGYSADRLIYDINLSEELNKKTVGASYGLFQTKLGEQIILVNEISLDLSENDFYVLLSISSSGIYDELEIINNTMWIFFGIGGGMIVILIIIVENITAHAVRKLKKSVDQIALGKYDTPIEIHTGDEIEDLSVSIKALSSHILDKTTSLERLNNSYYRFVPLSFLNTLGETKIEKVSKSLYAKRNMTVLFLRFNFSQSLANMESEGIFESINLVFEKIIPVIDSHDGTAYNFQFNGLNAIFSGAPENALLAAIKIREIVVSFNDILRSQNRRTVDMRIIISSSEVLLGFIGDEKRMEPTAVSTVISQSEEIEQLCAESGMYIVCMNNAFDALPKEKFRSRRVGKVRTADGEIHTIYDMFDSDPYSLIKLKEQTAMKFELGVKLFEKKDFVNARNVFMDIVKYAPGDGVSRNYMYLSEYNIGSDAKQLTYTVYNMPGT